MILRISSSTTAVVVQTVVCCNIAIAFIAPDQYANAQGLQGGPASLASNPPAAVTQPAQVQPYEQTDILAKASGFVSRVHVDIGDKVEKDELLAELWIPEMQEERLIRVASVEEAAAAMQQMKAAIVAAESLVEAASAKLGEAQASLAQYESDVDFRRSEYNRIAQLVSKETLNQALLDEKKNQLRSAESALAAARAAVVSAAANVQVEKARVQLAQASFAHAEVQRKLAEADLKKTDVLMSYSKLRAPFAGLITHRNVDTGAFVASAVGNHSEPLFTLYRVDRLRIVADIPESQAPRIQLGQQAVLVVDALKGKAFTGIVKRTAGVLDPRTRTLRVEAELSEPTSELRPGMFGSLTITLTPPPAAN
ncbi:MAG: efflux RND transporter periplasmic adaptor subunit [Pirellulales bacterium]